MDENRPEPKKPFKPKNWARIYSSCKGERYSDNVKSAPCKRCGVVSKKKKCQFCGEER